MENTLHIPKEKVQNAANEFVEINGVFESCETAFIAGSEFAESQYSPILQQALEALEESRKATLMMVYRADNRIDVEQYQKNHDYVESAIQSIKNLQE